jgi:phosphonate transport system substrate-binding protein
MEVPMRCALFVLLALVVLAPAAEAGELTVGLIPEQNVFKQMERYKPIAEYIENKTRIKIRFTVLPRYGNIIQSFTSEHMDAAFWGSFTGAMAIEKLGVEPIVRPLWFDGTSTYHGYIFVRKDSGIENVKDMKGKRIVFVEKATTAGYVFPLAYFKEHGVKNLDEYFAEHYFAGSHDAAIVAVLNKKMDIGCAKNTIFNLVAERDPRVKEELIILAESPKVPSNGLGVRRDLDAVTKSKLTRAFLNMSDDHDGKDILTRFGAIRFIHTSKADYGPVFQATKRANINLKSYQYKNE